MDRPSAVERSLREAAPHEIFDVIRSLIVRRHRAQAVELMMADYAMTRLQPVGVLPQTHPPVSVYDSAPGRAFGAQEAHCVYDRPASAVTVYLPVSVRGDRLGILGVTMRVGEGEDLAPAVLENLQECADALAHEVVVAERDTDLFLQARRAERLTLAAEMQWQLLPGRSCSRPEYSLGAQLEPAYAIFGDSFDWSASADDLYVTVSNGMGEGIDAALLTNLAVNALRNARRAGLSLGDQAYLADQAVYGQHSGTQYLSTLLFRFHLPTGDVEIIDAGSPRVWRVRRGWSSRSSWRLRCPWACSRTPPTFPSTSRSNPETACSSSVTASTTPCLRAVRSTASVRWPRRSTARVCCPPRKCPERCCRSCWATAAPARRRTTLS